MAGPSVTLDLGRVCRLLFLFCFVAFPQPYPDSSSILIDKLDRKVLDAYERYDQSNWLRFAIRDSKCDSWRRLSQDRLLVGACVGEQRESLVGMGGDDHSVVPGHGVGSFDELHPDRR